MDPKQTLIQEMNKAAAALLQNDKDVEALDFHYNSLIDDLNQEHRAKRRELKEKGDNSYERYAEFREALRLVEEENMDPLLARMSAAATMDVRRADIRRRMVDLDPFGHNPNGPYNHSRHQRRMKARPFYAYGKKK